MAKLSTRAEADVQKQLARLSFGQLHGPVGKGRWSDPTETREDGGQTVSGEFKVDNGCSFGDYDPT